MMLRCPVFEFAVDWRISVEFNTAIETICDYTNYGNRLQNYALRSILLKYGHCANIRMLLGVSSKWEYMIYEVRSVVQIILSMMPLGNRSLKYRRFAKSLQITSKYMPDGDFILLRQDLIQKNNNTFEKLIIGSDQVWNYQWLSKQELELRLGSFISDSHSIISYAASFGVFEIDDDVKPIFQKYLPRFKAISVREDRGAELVKEMTGLEATVVLDPTLMLPANKWLEITENFVPDDDRYILTYFLGRPSDEQECDIQSYAKAHDCHVRRIFDLRDKETYVAGPQDFVELFSKAQYVFTDSYHACCFSILFHKQFTVFNRAGMNGKSNMNSRMETLFRLFDLDSVMMDSGLAPEIDYEKVDHLLEENRRKSQNWLDKAMEG